MPPTKARKNGTSSIGQWDLCRLMFHDHLVIIMSVCRLAGQFFINIVYACLCHLLFVLFSIHQTNGYILCITGVLF